MTSWTRGPWPAPAAPPAPLVLPLGGTPPVSIAWITIDWKLAGMPRCFSLPVRLDRSWALTSAPRIATGNVFRILAHDGSRPHLALGVDPLAELRVADAGDIEMPPLHRRLSGPVRAS